MLYNVGKEVNKKFDEIMQQKFEHFCLKKLAEAKMNLQRAKAELERSSSDCSRYEKELYNMINIDGTLKNLYHEEARSVEYSNTLSQYKRDLKELANV